MAIFSPAFAPSEALPKLANIPSIPWSTTGETAAVVTRFGVAVIADSYWQAKTAVDSIDIKWQSGPLANIDNAAMYAYLQKELNESSGFTYHSAGDSKRDPAQGDKVLRATFRAPLLAMIPLRQGDATLGLLVLGSPDPTRYGAEMGTEFLMRIGDTAAAALSRLRPAA